jgi:hypothetical protein
MGGSSSGHVVALRGDKPDTAQRVPSLTRGAASGIGDARGLGWYTVTTAGTSGNLINVNAPASGATVQTSALRSAPKRSGFDKYRQANGNTYISPPRRAEAQHTQVEPQRLRRKVLSSLPRLGCTRQGCVNLGVSTRRGLSAARGAAEAEAPEMPIDLCAW